MALLCQRAAGGASTVPTSSDLPTLATVRSDSTNLYPAPNLTIVWGLDPILRGPLSIAVQKGNNELAAK